MKCLPIHRHITKLKLQILITALTAYVLNTLLGVCDFKLKIMFNYGAIDKTPTVIQIKAIIDYMEKAPDIKYNFTNMMKMNRIEPNKILLDLNNAHFGNTFEIIFNEQNEIITFKETGCWMS